jgi:hypothetical protein
VLLKESYRSWVVTDVLDRQVCLSPLFHRPSDTYTHTRARVQTLKGTPFYVDLDQQQLSPEEYKQLIAK